MFTRQSDGLALSTTAIVVQLLGRQTRPARQKILKAALEELENGPNTNSASVMEAIKLLKDEWLKAIQ